MGMLIATTNPYTLLAAGFVLGLLVALLLARWAIRKRREWGDF